MIKRTMTSTSGLSSAAPERQIEHVEVVKVFTKKASGKNTQRPELDALLSFVREGNDLWRDKAKVGAGKFRPLRPMPPA